MKDHEAVARIPTMAFWNSAKCSDSYYETQALDIEDPSNIERDEPEITEKPKQYYKKIQTLNIIKPYRSEKDKINAAEKLSLTSQAKKDCGGVKEHHIINKDGKLVLEIEGEAIPELAKDHKVHFNIFENK